MKRWYKEHYKIQAGDIEGVEVVDKKTHHDDRGCLTEIYRTDEEYHKNFFKASLKTQDRAAINQVYLVEDLTKWIVRAFHKHERLWDFFTIVHGRAKFVLFDDREDSPTRGNVKIIIGDARNKCLIAVPPGVYHGWQSLMDDTILLSIASHTYNSENPDEERIPHDSIGEDVWNIKFK